jgi:glycosyltransferase involved in cell wall biosynthesis
MKRRKLLYLSSSRLPSRDANSVHVMRMCDAFAEVCDVSLLARVSDKSIHEFYGMRNSFCIKNITVHNILRNLIRTISGRFDVIFGRNLKLLFLFSLFAKVAIEIHKPYDGLGFVSRLLLLLLLLIGRIRLIVVISGHLERSYRENLGPKLHILNLHDGANIVSDDIEYCGPVLKVGYAGHVYEGRGIPLIINLASACPFITFEIIGGREEDIAKWIALELPTNLRFIGFVSPSDVSSMLLKFDVLLAPYERIVTVLGKGDTSSYMSPLKIFEYMASGVPLIASDHESIKEVIGDDCGILCDPDDFQSWLNALQLLDDPQERRRLGMSARKAILGEYSWDCRASRVLENLYNV